MSSWTVQVKSAVVDWTPQAELTGFVNRVGSPVASSSINLDSEYLVPGVLRFTATGISGSNLIWNRSVVRSSDLRHPDIEVPELLLPAAPVAGYSYNIGGGRTAVFNANPAVGDQFDHWYGYSLDESGEFLPMLTFGLVYPGTQGSVIRLRLVNPSGAIRASCILQWTCGEQSIEPFSARNSDDAEWVTGDIGWLYLHDSQGIPGVVYPGSYAEVELSPFVPEDFSLMSNPLVLTCEVMSTDV